MGNYASKLLFYTNEGRKEPIEQQSTVQQATAEDNKMCTPIFSEKRVLGDPRSISAGIKRTPIEIKSTSVGISKPSALPKYLQKKQYLETNMDAVMPPLTPKKHFRLKSVDSDKSESNEVENYSTPNASVAKNIKVITPIDKERFIILGLDPRSPAADFDRTPILLPRSLALIKARSQENLSRRGSYETDIYNNFHQEISTSLSIPEIKLSETVEKNLKTDARETDTVEQDVLPSTSQCDFDLSISKSEQEITVIKNPKYTDGKKQSLILDEQTITINDSEKNETEKQDDSKNIKFNTKIKDDKIKLWHDLVSSEENVSGKEDKKELPQEKALREDVIITFDNYTTTSTSLKSTKAKDFRKKEDIKGRKKNTKVDVKLNEEKVFIFENKQGIEIHENRTPLGNRSNNGQMQRKPQLRNNAAIRTTMMQQENTPPQIHNGKTRNGNQWDSNSTVLI
ncbi:uncharacterized protein LOC105836253 [Monomorium pharaonis]|uniref:uncharacterized protein LOC105836253 n=1 Tax=Monomorium pharaonis TaxID=307658 RepID=UPI00063F0F7B|nr:uncharacterized protein LOC105836253 [Monomorium pharaonis]XP_036148223.1 uncharacterized protein LOC105836253 [Monomorium pharaonis]